MTDREKLLNLLMDEIPNPSPWDGEIRLLLDHLLANGVVVREKGEWIWDKRHSNYFCSRCGAYDITIPHFCSDCGADMRKGENDGGLD